MAMQAQVARAQQEAALVKEGKLDPEEIRARWVLPRRAAAPREGRETSAALCCTWLQEARPPA